MKITCCLLLLLPCAGLYAQSYTPLDKNDIISPERGKLEMIVLRRDSSTLPEGYYVTSYHGAQHSRFYFHVTKDGLLNDSAIIEMPEKKFRGAFFLKNGKMDGIGRSYENGQLTKELEVQDGILLLERDFKESKIAEESQQDAHGQIMLTREYEQGVLKSVTQYAGEAHTPIETIYFPTGKVHEVHNQVKHQDLVYDAAGQLRESSSMDTANLWRVTKTFNAQGLLLTEVAEKKATTIQSDELWQINKTYYPNGKIKIETKSTPAQSITTTYDVAGKVISKKTTAAPPSIQI